MGLEHDGQPSDPDRVVVFWTRFWKIRVSESVISPLGKSVVVRVNDRGPYKLSRIIDLSYGAAQKLDFVNEGTTKVRITAVSAPNTDNGTLYLLVASFRIKDNAENYKKIVEKVTSEPIRIRTLVHR